MQSAVLGLGRMGHEVAGRLLEGGHAVTVWNRSPGKGDDLRRAGAEVAASPAEAAEGADMVLMSLADDAAVLSVVTGEGGVATVLGDEAVLVDASTVSPATARRIAEVTGGRSLASPILGGPGAVAAGEAVYLVSGPREGFERVAAAYQSLTSDVRYLGDPVERALQLKLLANYLLLSGIVVLSEVVATAEAIEFPAQVLKEFLSSSPLVAPGLRNRIEALVGHDHAGWFTTVLGAKDVALAEDLARSAGVRLATADIVKRRYEEAAATGHGAEDLTAVIELLSPS